MEMTSQETDTTFRFGSCELNEGRRSLCVKGREIDLQPRVFDLLAYLIRHRDRVVTKEELLDALWPGTIVVDNALQRVVSLARAALAEGGARESLRTYSRHGYRFCGEAVEQASPQSTVARSTALTDAYRALDAKDWEAAIREFTDADRRGELTPDDLHEWGSAAIWAGRSSEAVPRLERAIPLYLDAGDRRGAARAAVLLARIHTERMEPAVARGLVTRAAAFLEGEAACSERGHLAWVASRLALMEGKLHEVLERADEALAISRQLRDTDLEALGLLYRGHALIALGKIEQGVALHDEAAAVVISGAVSAWAGGIVYCGIISATRNRCDWNRAGQWTEKFTEWCGASGMPAFPGTCRLHRAEVLGVRGELATAGREVEALGELLSRIAPWAEGDAYRVLGDFHLMRGDLNAAEIAFRRAHALGWEPQPGLARLQLARGKPEAAMRGLERALLDDDWALRERRGQLLSTLVHAALAAGEPEVAQRALDELERNPALWSTAALAAMVDDARSALASHHGQRSEAIVWLRRALQRWLEVGAPLGVADVRVRLAEQLVAEGDDDAAELELSAAEASCEQLGSTAFCARCAAVRETLNR